MKTRGVLLAAILLLARPSFGATTERLELPNGLRVVVRPAPATDIVAIELLLDVSARDEPPGKHGIRSMIQRLLLRGTQSQPGAQMGQRLAEVGGVADVSVGLDYAEIYALVPSQGLETALELLAGAVRAPAFLPEEVEKQRRVALDAASSARDDAFRETYLAFRGRFYGEHPYGRDTSGDRDSLRAITREDIVRFHDRHYRPQNAVLAICGGVRPATAGRLARQFFGEWQSGESFPPRPRTPPEPLQYSQAVAREVPTRQGHLLIGFPAPEAGQERYFVIQVIDSLLGGGSGARLNKVLREQEGIAYQIWSFHPTLAGESHFAVYAAADPLAMERTKELILGVLRGLCQETVPSEELARAKRYLLGSYALSRQRMKDQAYLLAWYEVLGLGVEFEGRYSEAVSAVTAEDVQAMANAIFRRFVVAVSLPDG